MVLTITFSTFLIAIFDLKKQIYIELYYFFINFFKYI